MCAQHPTVAAVEICNRCGAFTCVECVQWRSDQPLCQACSRRTWFGQDAGLMALVSAGLGFLGLGCGPLGGVAVILGGSELGMIASGRSPKGGRRLALIGMGLGALGVALGVAILIRFFNNPGALGRDALP